VGCPAIAGHDEGVVVREIRNLQQEYDRPVRSAGFLDVYGQFGSDDRRCRLVSDFAADHERVA
jgi:hypothetical protein